jgi:UDPglucose 6-dehydrogenase
VLPWIEDDAVVVSSSQLPAGSVGRVAREFDALRPGTSVAFVSAPENLRLGTAIARFKQPDRVVLGVSSARGREVMSALLAPVADRIVWMSIESAEMTKHALNAFLAMSVTFINEVASICEVVGADAKEVERGLKSDHRIGPGAYLSPGAAFAGGTLARDVVFLEEMAGKAGVRSPVVSGVRDSNRVHASWPLRALRANVPSWSRSRIAVWGLTYTPGTDTLRRSNSVELCRALAAAGAAVTAFDPAIHELPSVLDGVLTLASSPTAALDGADAVIVATEWPVFREQGAEALIRAMATPLVIDPGRFLVKTMGADPRIRYVAVGAPRA